MKKIKISWEVSKKQKDVEVSYCFKRCDINQSSGDDCNGKYSFHG